MEHVLNEEAALEIDLLKPFSMQLEVLKAKNKRVIRTDAEFAEFFTIIDGPTRLKALTKFAEEDKVVLIRSQRRTRFVVKSKDGRDYIMWHRHTYIVNSSNGYYEIW